MMNIIKYLFSGTYRAERKHQRQLKQTLFEFAWLDLHIAEPEFWRREYFSQEFVLQTCRLTVTYDKPTDTWILYTQSKHIVAPARAAKTFSTEQLLQYGVEFAIERVTNKLYSHL